MFEFIFPTLSTHPTPLTVILALVLVPVKVSTIYAYIFPELPATLPTSVTHLHPLSTFPYLLFMFARHAFDPLYFGPL